MAKRKEVILQEVLSTPQLWDDAMTKEKLYVVDVHQKWCGPCKAITGMLKRIKNELGDDYLRFAVAEADSLPSLESYRGKCEPVFLFFGCGQLVAYVRGCNAPLLQQTIVDTLEHEHKVQNGEAERKVVKDLHETEKEEEKEEEGEEEEEEEGEIVARKQISVALIKPDVVSNGQVDEILEKINEAGIEVLVNEERLLSEDEAKSFYQNKADEEYFDDLISYVTSGPSRVLVLTKSGSGEGVVEQWRDIIGPFDAAVAKEENPDSLRAIYGTDAKANALHGSSSQEEAARELGFFFPDFEPPTFRVSSAAASRKSKASARSRKSAKKGLQRTLAIIRPDALKKHKDAIMEKIAEAGFEVSMMKEMELTQEQAKAFYKEHEEKEYFQALVDQMTSGPVLALCLAHTDAVQKWRDMLGPKEPGEAIEQQPESLRAQFHVEEAPVNMIHGSDSIESATEELKSLFHVEQTLAVIKPDAMEEKDAIIKKLKEAGFMISMQKDMNLTKEIASEIYKSKEGAEFYDSLVDHMTSGPTLMMVLSAEDAVSKLRNMMGPTDPEEAKESAPESLRALFAKSVLENAIHSPSNAESAEERIKFIFGDMEFNWDGTVRGDEEVIMAEQDAAPGEEQSPDVETIAEAAAQEEGEVAEKGEDAVAEEEGTETTEAPVGEEESKPEEQEKNEEPASEDKPEETTEEPSVHEEVPQEAEGESGLDRDREQEGGNDDNEVGADESNEFQTESSATLKPKPASNAELDEAPYQGDNNKAMLGEEGESKPNDDDHNHNKTDAEENSSEPKGQSDPSTPQKESSSGDKANPLPTDNDAPNSDNTPIDSTVEVEK